MDELEFRRRIIAQPNDKSTDVSEFAKDNAERQYFIDEMREFDKFLQDEVKIPVPENLAESILLNTSLKEKAQQEEQIGSNKVVDARSRFKLDRVHLSLAASFVVAISAFFFSVEHNKINPAGEHALAHVYYEINALDKSEPISLQTVNDKLALLGGQIDELPGNVTYAMFCDFEGEKGLHLIFESDFGPMTVFIVPSQNKMFEIGSDEFHDDRFEGHINKGPQADTVLIASLGAPVNMYNDKVNSAIRWL
ncbi:DUF3379 family protein [Pseudoalteromonas sp. MMG010]|uniref:DUF3379 family protein n=1 Tax=Pseudoalteromonas sp. MMG010 TaxID=2822685 RepID=UPI001B39E901|nr:DUF3379 family protein [Pseudoalteromonas sp. MMG010]MBQ4831847.1 DUF3379 family protein [Pseudoalteromonas sp. MMG010]